MHATDLACAWKTGVNLYSRLDEQDVFLCSENVMDVDLSQQACQRQACIVTCG